jgi:small-conductance mechanosensitive channel
MPWQNTLEILQKTFQQSLNYLFPLLLSLSILCAGWAIAKFFQFLTVKILKLLHLDIASEKTGVSGMLAKGEIENTPAELISNLVYWFLMLIVFVVAINALGVPVSSGLFKSILQYVPNVIAAVFVLILGMFVASLVSAVVLLTASNTGISNAKLLARGTQYAIIIFAAVLALDQLGIETRILASAITVIIGAIGLAFAIAFGLGGKEIAASFMIDLLKLTREDRK